MSKTIRIGKELRWFHAEINGAVRVIRRTFRSGLANEDLNKTDEWVV